MMYISFFHPDIRLQLGCLAGESNKKSSSLWLARKITHSQLIGKSMRNVVYRRSPIGSAGLDTPPLTRFVNTYQSQISTHSLTWHEINMWQFMNCWKECVITVEYEMVYNVMRSKSVCLPYVICCYSTTWTTLILVRHGL